MLSNTMQAIQPGHLVTVTDGSGVVYTNSLKVWRYLGTETDMVDMFEMMVD